MRRLQRSARLASVLQQLEERFGSVAAITDASAGVRTAFDGQLRASDVAALVSHEALAVHVRGFYDAGRAAAVARRVLADDDVRNWSVAYSDSAAQPSEVEAVGLPHNVAVAEGRLDEYFAGSVAQTRKWRAAGDGAGDEAGDEAGDGLGIFGIDAGDGPELGGGSGRGSGGADADVALGPMDKFRLEMDEIWPDGLRLAKDASRGLPYSAGVPRIMRPAARFDPGRWTRGFAHVDELDLMRPDRGLYSANVYLQNAPSGGELQIWPVTFRTRWDFYRNAPTLALCLLQDADAQAVLRARLPEPVSISVQPGDLVLLCTQRPHAVRGPIVGGTRVSMQAFVQYKRGQPLLVEA